jgi:hypothetical protein
LGFVNVSSKIFANDKCRSTKLMERRRAIAFVVSLVLPTGRVARGIGRLEFTETGREP